MTNTTTADQQNAQNTQLTVTISLGLAALLLIIAVAAYAYHRYRVTHVSTTEAALREQQRVIERL
jgi:hypothetical protein